MRFSTKTTYGIRALAKLADSANQGNISLARIAKEEKISLKYLERLFSLLKKNGLVQAEKGTSGGYRLARQADEIDLLSIVRALEGTTAPFYCLNEKGKFACKGRNRCPATKVLSRVQGAIDKTLADMSLADLNM